MPKPTLSKFDAGDGRMFYGAVPLVAGDRTSPQAMAVVTGGVDQDGSFVPDVGAAGSTPLVATLNATGQSDAFVPQLGRAMWLTLSGTWTGTVKLLRSIDGGTTKLPVTQGGAAYAQFTGNAQEKLAIIPSEVGETYYLDFTRSTGSVIVRLSQ